MPKQEVNSPSQAADLCSIEFNNAKAKHGVVPKSLIRSKQPIVMPSYFSENVYKA